MTVQELIDFLTKNCVDFNKQILLYNTEWEHNDPIDFIDFDSDGNPVLY